MFANRRLRERVVRQILTLCGERDRIDLVFPNAKYVLKRFSSTFGLSVGVVRFDLDGLRATLAEHRPVFYRAPVFVMSLTRGTQGYGTYRFHAVDSDGMPQGSYVEEPSNFFLHLWRSQTRLRPIPMPMLLALETELGAALEEAAR